MKSPELYLNYVGGGEEKKKSTSLWKSCFGVLFYFLEVSAISAVFPSQNAQQRVEKVLAEDKNKLVYDKEKLQVKCPLVEIRQILPIGFLSFPLCCCVLGTL